MPQSAGFVSGRRSRRGAILVGVLWVTILLSALAVALRVHMSSIALSVRITEDKAAASALADAGLAVAAARIHGAPIEGPQRLGYTLDESVELPAGRVDVSLRNEVLRVDLNRAEPPLIEGALIAAGAAPNQADRLAQNLVEMREKADGSPFGALQTIDELVTVPDMVPALALRAARFATVSSGLETLPLDAVDDELLRAIPGLPRSLLQAIAGWRAGRVPRAQLDQLLAESGLHTSERSLVWRASVSVSLTSGHSEAYEVLMLVREGDEAAYRVLDWRRPSDEVN